MSVALSTDQKQESAENITGAPDIAAQQIREHQVATHSSSSSQQHADSVNGQQHLSESIKTSSQHVDENSTGHS